MVSSAVATWISTLTTETGCSTVRDRHPGPCSPISMRMDAFSIPGTGARSETVEAMRKEPNSTFPWRRGPMIKRFSTHGPKWRPISRTRSRSCCSSTPAPIRSPGSDHPSAVQRARPRPRRGALEGVCDRFCAGRILGMGAGGYNRGNLARAWTRVVEGFADPASAARFSEYRGPRETSDLGVTMPPPGNGR